MKALQRQTLAQGVKTFVPSNYALSFDIIPFGTTNQHGSIIHYTQDNSDIGPKGRIPGMLQVVIYFDLVTNHLHTYVAIFMDKNSSQLSVKMATTSDPNESITAPSLPLNEITRVRVEAVGQEVFVFYNTSLVAIKMVTGKRFSGIATVMISNPWPWYDPAKAKISSISMIAISNFSSRSIGDFAGPISKGVAYEKTYVPPDFALSFNITPTGLASAESDSNIIRYTQDNIKFGPRAFLPGKCIVQWLFLHQCSHQFLL